jgi:hypothetical protein
VTSITAVTDPATPKILEAYGSAGDRLDFDSVYHRDFITAQVPYYTGMARGHTVRMTWENPRHIYHSEVVTVGTPGMINIPIPRIEVVDAIGHTVKVYYTVRTAPGTALIPSRTLQLYIDPYEFDLLAPSLSTDQKTLSVRYVGMVRGYTVLIRATGKTTWDSDERDVQTVVTPTFTLPSNWIAENRGIDTRINYSVYKSGSGQRLMFSKVLRVRVGESAPVLSENFDDKPTQLITSGQRIELPSMAITFLSGSGNMGIQPLSTAPGNYPALPGKRAGQLLNLCYQHQGVQRCRLDLRSACSKVSFWHTWVDTSPLTAFYYNASNQLLGQRVFSQSLTDAHMIEFSANGITRIEIQTSAADWIGLDHFLLTP